MFERITRGWGLAKQSFQVLRADKKLLVFPIVSGIACLMVLVSFALPLYFSGLAEQMAKHDEPSKNIAAYAVLFAFYLANYFVIVFFNSALVACAVVRLEGGEPTIGMGIAAAMNRLPQIFGWSLVAASVGVILQAIESRSERVGAIVASVLGMGWSIVTFFVVPVLVVEKAGPITAIKRSTTILKKTWGESLSANFGVSAIAFLFSLPLIAAIFGGVFLLASQQVALGGAVIALAVLGLLTVSLISSAVSTIALAALYLYGTTNRVPQAFDANLLTGAFGQK